MPELWANNIVVVNGMCAIRTLAGIASLSTGQDTGRDESEWSKLGAKPLKIPGGAGGHLGCSVADLLIRDASVSSLQSSCIRLHLRSDSYPP
jgi:hypothetical protein